MLLPSGGAEGTYHLATFSVQLNHHRASLPIRHGQSWHRLHPQFHEAPPTLANASLNALPMEQSVQASRYVRSGAKARFAWPEGHALHLLGAEVRLSDVWPRGCGCYGGRSRSRSLKAALSSGTMRAWRPGPLAEELFIDLSKSCRVGPAALCAGHGRPREAPARRPTPGGSRQALLLPGSDKSSRSRMFQRAWKEERWALAALASGSPEPGPGYLLRPAGHEKQLYPPTGPARQLGQLSVRTRRSPASCPPGHRRETAPVALALASFSDFQPANGRQQTRCRGFKVRCA